MTSRKRHLNPKIKKALVYIATIGTFAAGATSYYGGRQAMAEASMITVEVQSKLDTYDKSIQEYEIEINRLKEANNQLLEENKSLKSRAEELRREVSRGYSRAIDVEITAYTLSESSCNKGADHPSYGLTANGTNLAGHTLESARAIAVDPDIIPLGSQVRISFKDEDMHQYNGVYTACDTGGAIKGNRIDIFAGEEAESLAMSIGKRRAKVEILS